MRVDDIYFGKLNKFLFIFVLIQKRRKTIESWLSTPLIPRQRGRQGFFIIALFIYLKIKFGRVISSILRSFPISLNLQADFKHNYENAKVIVLFLLLQ